MGGSTRRGLRKLSLILRY